MKGGDSMDQHEEYVTVADAAQLLNLGESTVWLLLKRSDIQRYRIPGQGKRTYLRRADLPKLREPIPVTAEVGKAAA